MPIEITMPALSPTMKSGNLIKWLVKEGDEINSGDAIAEIETDKAVMEIETADGGILGKILIQAGTKNISVGTALGLILGVGEKPSELDGYLSQSENSTKQMAKNAPVTNAMINDKINNDTTPPHLNVHHDRLLVSPVARRIAKESGIDLHHVVGSGPRGRIIKADLDTQISRSGDGNSTSKNIVGSKDFDKNTVLIPHSQMRRVIADRLCESKQKAPHFYLNMECDVTRLLSMRIDLNEWHAKLSEGSQKISVNDVLIKASALALKRYPRVNASWTEEGTLLYNAADVAVAVALQDGLITPIVRSADIKGIAVISTEMRQLIVKAKAGKLLPHEFQGCGFSISNLGMYGVQEFYAIINFPQACILSVGASIKRPVVNASGAIVVAEIMNIGLSVDHRVVDGALASEFLGYIKYLLENPLALSL